MLSRKPQKSTTLTRIIRLVFWTTGLTLIMSVGGIVFAKGQDVVQFASFGALVGIVNGAKNEKFATYRTRGVLFGAVSGILVGIAAWSIYILQNGAVPAEKALLLVFAYAAVGVFLGAF